jgi:hypothetical protein
MTAVAVAALLPACAGGGGDMTISAPTSSVTSVTVSPSTAYLVAGARQMFVATVGGTGSYDPSVTWTATAGSFTSTGGTSTTYIAPSSAGSWTITAQSVQDRTRTSSAVLNPVNPYSARLRRQEAYSPTTGLTTYWTYTYSSTNSLLKVENYSPASAFQGVTNYTIDLAGHRTRTDVYGSTGALTSYQLIEYSDNYLPIRLTTFSAAGVLTSRTENTFDPATRTKLSSDNYGSSNTLTSRYVFTYDAGNNRTTNTNYSSTGAVTGRTVYEFVNGLMTKCTFYDANNVITGWRIFIFDLIPTTEDLFAFGAW